MKKCVYLLLITVSLSVAYPLLAATWYVDQAATGSENGLSWANAFVEIGDAVAAVSPNDTILIAEGVYEPSDTIDLSETTGIKLIGDEQNVVIQKYWDGYNELNGILIKLGEGSELHNLTIDCNDVLDFSWTNVKSNRIRNAITADNVDNIIISECIVKSPSGPTVKLIDCDNTIILNSCLHGAEECLGVNNQNRLGYHYIYGSSITSTNWYQCAMDTCTIGGYIQATYENCYISCENTLELGEAGFYATRGVEISHYDGEPSEDISIRLSGCEIFSHTRVDQYTLVNTGLSCNEEDAKVYIDHSRIRLKHGTGNIMIPINFSNYNLLEIANTSVQDPNDTIEPIDQNDIGGYDPNLVAITTTCSCFGDVADPNANPPGDGIVDIGDVDYLVEQIEPLDFYMDDIPAGLKCADMTNSIGLTVPDGIIDFGDLNFLVNYVYTIYAPSYSGDCINIPQVQSSCP